MDKLDTWITVRLPPKQLAALDAWISDREQISSRAEAVEQIVSGAVRPKGSIAADAERYVIVAKGYAIAAATIAQNVDWETSPVRLPYTHLVAMSFELAFKAILLRAGTPASTIRRKFGHDLARLHRSVIKAGFLPKEEMRLRACIKVLTPQHNDNRFRYIGNEETLHIIHGVKAYDALYQLLEDVDLLFDQPVAKV